MVETKVGGTEEYIARSHHTVAHIVRAGEWCDCYAWVGESHIVGKGVDTKYGDRSDTW